MGMAAREPYAMVAGTQAGKVKTQPYGKVYSLLLFSPFL